MMRLSGRRRSKLIVTRDRKWLGFRIGLAGVAIAVIGYFVAQAWFELGLAIAFIGWVVGVGGMAIHYSWLSRYGPRLTESLDIVFPNRKWLRHQRDKDAPTS
jgi:hypothetical protein